MFVTEVTFSVLKTTPLYPLTHDKEDEYSNVKPQASCTVRFADGECDPSTTKGKKLISDAYAAAQEAVVGQLVEFHEMFTSQFNA